MAKNDWILDQTGLKDQLSYDPETGVFTWAQTRPGTAKKGTHAGCKNREGYVQIMVRGKYHAAHRLAWLYVYGEWPVLQVDHINGNPNDNRIANLRLVSASENAQNKRKARSDNSSGFLGVTAHYGKWRAQISVMGERHHLGNFSTPEEAHAAYVEAKRRIHSKVCTL